MGLYSLLGIVVLMLAAIVATREPQGTSEFTGPSPKKRAAPVFRVGR